jgi:hypothetical protein
MWDQAEQYRTSNILSHGLLYTEIGVGISSFWVTSSLTYETPVETKNNLVDRIVAACERFIRGRASLTGRARTWSVAVMPAMKSVAGNSNSSRVIN